MRDPARAGECENSVAGASGGFHICHRALAIPSLDAANYLQEGKQPMTEVAIMLEGQDGLNWPRFQRIAREVEDMGFAGLHRSDHIVNPDKPDKDSLDLWISLTWLADHTERITFGPLVSPVSFRHPVHTARMAAAVDDLSGGRLILGLGAGWLAREHHNYGWDLLTVPARFKRFREGLDVITELLQSDEHISYTGRYYYLHDAILLPRPQRAGGPPILIGGNGPKYTLPLVAEYADIWNGVFIDVEGFADRNRRLDDLLRAAGRAPEDVRRTVMLGIVFGKDDDVLEAHLQGRDAGKLRAQGTLVGTPSAIAYEINRYAEAGAERVMLQWLDLDDIHGLEALARHVLPEVQI
jgi:F420-dependent oxidoreductase-like protein